MKTIYGCVEGYHPFQNGSQSGFVQFLKFQLEPGGNYEIQFSNDGGLTWPIGYPYSVPAGTQASIADILMSLTVPGGIPVRVVQK